MADITLESIIDMVADRIAARIESRNSSRSSVESKRLLTTDEAAIFLGRTRDSIQHMMASGKIPTVRSDRRVFFDVRDLERFIDQNKEAGVI
jgi:excisionase family DNA binding protein